MNSKLSMWKLICGVAGMGLLITNCTIKTESDNGANAGSGNTASGTCTPGTKVTQCTCAGNTIGSQTCLQDGTYGACVCATNTEGGASSGGATSYAGGAGVAAVNGGASMVGDAGAGGDPGPVIDPTDCGSCLATLCPLEWAACEADNETKVTTTGDPYCLSQGKKAAPGQMEQILVCIATERAKGVVKRDAVRACGSTLGKSADPQFFEWPPADNAMTPATEAVMNCMADKSDEVDNQGAWATDPANYPPAGPLPWDDMTCAKLACTSKL